MLLFFAQLWGGVMYLLNKVFFAVKEHSTEKEKKQKWQTRAWVVYILGVSGWLYIFWVESNWIVFAVEAAGFLLMIIGLRNAVQGVETESKWLDNTARLIVTVGIFASLYDFGGFYLFTQYLELGIAAGFLFGTYYLGKDNPSGYLWFLLMNASNAILMGVQNYPILMLQQIISFLIIADAFAINKSPEIYRRFWKFS